jgi:HD-GYP domain-containing protein (c-di-GMP phosphodiesterase class II)
MKQVYINFTDIKELKEIKNKKALIPIKETSDMKNISNSLLKELISLTVEKLVKEMKKNINDFGNNIKIYLIERGPYKRIVLLDQNKLISYLSDLENNKEIELEKLSDTPVVGTLVFQRTNQKDLWSTMSIASEEGYGALLYELAMSMIYPSWYSPDDPSRVNELSKRVWVKFFNREDVDKKKKYISSEESENPLNYQYKIKNPISYESYKLDSSIINDFSYGKNEFDEIISDLGSSYFLNNYDLTD